MMYIQEYESIFELETSEYPLPIAPIIPPKNDKVWNYIKSKVTRSPLWGVNAKIQSKVNSIIRD